jgi:hypothetical protein
VAASIKRSVTPLIAETTTTTALSRAALAEISAARAMQEASPTDVPPNFMTTSVEFMLIMPAGPIEVADRPYKKTAQRKLYTRETAFMAWIGSFVGEK